jgi:hypothetical protein
MSFCGVGSPTNACSNPKQTRVLYLEQNIRTSLFENENLENLSEEDFETLALIMCMS